MLYFPNSRIIAIIATALVVMLFAVPNFVPEHTVKTWPQWAQRHVVLGLDLQGGAHLLLEVDANAVKKEKLNQVADDARRMLREARIRFTAFAYTSTPEMPGKVTYVATDRTVDPQSKSEFYSVRIEIDVKALHREHLQLRSGMPAEIFISTGNRSLLSYLSKPMTDQFARTFRGE